MEASAHMAKLIHVPQQIATYWPLFGPKVCTSTGVSPQEERCKEEICLDWTEAWGISTGNFGVPGSQGVVWKGGHRGTCLCGPKDSSSSGEGHGLSNVGAGFSKVGPSFLGQVLRTVLTPCWGRQEVTKGSVLPTSLAR